MAAATLALLILGLSWITQPVAAAESRSGIVGRSLGLQPRLTGNTACKGTTLDWYSSVVGETPCMYPNQSGILKEEVLQTKSIGQVERMRGYGRFVIVRVSTEFSLCAPRVSLTPISSHCRRDGDGYTSGCLQRSSWCVA